jgi:uncharacterized protein (DUF983 family)
MREASHWSALQGILRQVCPRCREGLMFHPFSMRHWLDMYAACPVCGLKFDREQGYFIGAMYVSYGLSIPPVLALVFTFWWLAGWPLGSAIMGAFVAYLPFVPLAVRFSRVIWIYIDRSVDPN